MGRTIASITQTWQQEEAALKRFQRALRKEDQLLLDELLVLSRLHLAEASYASNLYPLDMYLIAILLEVYKQLKSSKGEYPGRRGPQHKAGQRQRSAFSHDAQRNAGSFWRRNPSHRELSGRSGRAARVRRLHRV